MSDLIHIVANGQTREVSPVTSVADFVASCGWQPTQVVVEHNGRVIGRDQLTKIALNEGDQIEIIVPVAGG